MLNLKLISWCSVLLIQWFDQVNNLREIQALRKLAPHANIIHLEEVLFDAPSGRLAMVFELMEANLYDLISGKGKIVFQIIILKLI